MAHWGAARRVRTRRRIQRIVLATALLGAAVVSGPPSLAATCPGHEAESRPQRVGTDGNDVLVSDRADEIVCGLGGNDVLKASPAGGNLLEGGAGSDVLCARQAGAKDTLDGGPGIDRVRFDNSEAPTATERFAPIAFCATSAQPPPAVDGTAFTENFTWQGSHAAFVGDGSTVWWNRDNWDVRGDTHNNAVVPQGKDNRGNPNADYGTAPDWPWMGYHVDIHKSASSDPRDGKPDNTAGVAGGNGTAGVGIMHLDFQGILSARLRNPMLISSSAPGEVSFFAPKFVTTGFWWEVAITPATDVAGGERTIVPARYDSAAGRFESLPSPFRNDVNQGGSTNGPGHRDDPADSVNLISTGFPDGPDCKQGDKFGWHTRFAVSKWANGQSADYLNLVDSMNDLPSTSPAERFELYPWRIVFKPDHITLFGDVDKNGQMEIHGDYAVQVPWPEVFVHLLGVMYQGDHHPQWSCGFNENNGVTQVAELPWKQVRVAPVKYSSSASFPREATGTNGPRAGGFVYYDTRDIGRHGAAQKSQPQANDHAYDKYADYAWCSPFAPGIECGDEARARQDVTLKLTLTQEDIARVAVARLLADVRYLGTVSADVNGRSVGTFAAVQSRRDDFEREAFVERSLPVDPSVLKAGENTVTLHLGGTGGAAVDRVQLEVGRS